MNLHALIWLGLFAFLARWTFQRASWGVPLYMLTVYALPAKWWWGRGLLTTVGRWNLLAALILATAVYLDNRRQGRDSDGTARPVLFILLLYMINATCVHFFFAANPPHSWVGLHSQWKMFALFVLMVTVIHDKWDLELVLWSMVLLTTYVSYEVVWNDAGGHQDGRAGGNIIGSICAMSIPLGGYFLFSGNLRQKAIAAVSLVFTLEFTLQTVSRGVYLGVVGAAIWFVLEAKGRVRKYAIGGILLGVIAAYVQARSDRDFYWERFSSVFSSSEQQDVSATSRTELWSRGLKMIGDHPLGSGYQAAFHSDLGYTYVEDVRDHQGSPHNGYIELAASWGIQGAVLFLAAAGVAWLQSSRSIAVAMAAGDDNAALMGYCIHSSIIIFLIARFFSGSVFVEHAFWWMALAVTYQRSIKVTASIAQAVSVQGNQRALPPRQLAHHI